MSFLWHPSAIRDIRSVWNSSDENHQSFGSAISRQLLKATKERSLRDMTSLEIWHRPSECLKTPMQMTKNLKVESVSSSRHVLVCQRHQKLNNISGVRYTIWLELKWNGHHLACHLDFFQLSVTALKHLRHPQIQLQALCQNIKIWCGLSRLPLRTLQCLSKGETLTRLEPKPSHGFSVSSFSDQNTQNTKTANSKRFQRATLYTKLQHQQLSPS